MSEFKNRYVLPLQIRRQMIDGKLGEMTIRTLVKSIDEVRFLSVLFVLFGCFLVIILYFVDLKIRMKKGKDKSFCP